MAYLSGDRKRRRKERRVGGKEDEGGVDEARW